MEKLELKFTNELQDKMFRAAKECKYRPNRFNQMLAQYGGVETAKKLIATGMVTGIPSEGYTKLYALERLDLTMEDSVCKPEYRSLFTQEEIQYCRQLLGDI